MNYSIAEITVGNKSTTIPVYDSPVKGDNLVFQSGSVNLYIPMEGGNDFRKGLFAGVNNVTAGAVKQITTTSPYADQPTKSESFTNYLADHIPNFTTWSNSDSHILYKNTYTSFNGDYYGYTSLTNGDIITYKSTTSAIIIQSYDRMEYGYLDMYSIDPTPSDVGDIKYKNNITSFCNGRGMIKTSYMYGDGKIYYCPTPFFNLVLVNNTLYIPQCYVAKHLMHHGNTVCVYNNTTHMTVNMDDKIGEYAVTTPFSIGASIGLKYPDPMILNVDVAINTTTNYGTYTTTKVGTYTQLNTYGSTCTNVEAVTTTMYDGSGKIITVSATYTKRGSYTGTSSGSGTYRKIDTHTISSSTYTGSTYTWTYINGTRTTLYTVTDPPPTRTDGQPTHTSSTSSTSSRTSSSSTTTRTSTYTGDVPPPTRTDGQPAYTGTQSSGASSSSGGGDVPPPSIIVG